MKKIIPILLVAVIGLTLFACGKGTTNTGSLTAYDGSPSDTVPNDNPASNDSPSDTSPYDEQEAHGGDDRGRLTDYKYSDIRLTSIDTIWDKYITEQTGEDVLDLWKADWRTAQGSAFSLIEIVDELKVSKEKFVELNNKKLGEIRSTNYFTEEVIFRDYCFTDEEIEIIYSGDKKRIAEAFANPYAVIAGDWEIYPLRWIINNPASLYKEKQISVEALETAVNKLVEKGEVYISDEDSAALLARVEEYKKMQ